jgi:cyanophycinase
MLLTKIPKGKLMIIGGAEDKGSFEQPDIIDRNSDFKTEEILKRLLPPKRSRRAIEIITTASEEPDDISKRYQKAFLELGFKRVGFLNMGDNLEASNPSFTKRIEKAHAVLFSGGDQFRLATILGNTDVLRATHKRYMEDDSFIVAGTSAGAMAAGLLMITEGENNEAILKGTVKINSGLGFINGCIIDTHFIKRGRFGRLAQAIIMNPACVGLGLGEDTAMFIEKGRLATCIGSGMVIVIDGKNIGHTNMPYAEDDHPVCVEQLNVHILCEGSAYDMEKRTFVPSSKDLKMQRSMK